MKRIQLYAAGVAVAIVPAVVGLAGNASFSQTVPLRSPVSGSVDDGPTHDVNDDRVTGVDDAKPSASPTRAAKRASENRGRRAGTHGSDDGLNHDARDDHGGLRHESGSDDNGTDDHGGSTGRGGADDPVTHDATDDRVTRPQAPRTTSTSSGSGGSGGSGGSHHSGGDNGGSGGHGSDD